MAYICRAMRQKQKADHQYETEMAAMKRGKDRLFIQVPHEWHTKQTKDAVLFPSYGWVPKASIQWNRNGMRLPWSIGTNHTDKLLIAAEFVKDK